MILHIIMIINANIKSHTQIMVPPHFFRAFKTTQNASPTFHSRQYYTKMWVRKIFSFHCDFLFSPLFFTTEESIGFVKIFDFRFLMDLHVLGCPDGNLTISGKCLSVYLCVSDKNFVASVARELMNRISWNFKFSITPT